MKSAINALSVCTIFFIAQTAALAEDWFDRFDKDDDNHWSYTEFREAHNDYWKTHEDEKVFRESELRAEFARRAAEHRSWVDMEGVRGFHDW